MRRWLYIAAGFGVWVLASPLVYSIHREAGRRNRLYAALGADRDSWKLRAEIAEAAIKRVERERDANEKLADDVLGFVKEIASWAGGAFADPYTQLGNLKSKARELLRRKAELYDKEHGAK